MDPKAVIDLYNQMNSQLVAFVSLLWTWLSNSIDWVMVFTLGLLAGVADIIARYRDEPGRALRTPPGIIYVLLNGLASVIALALTRALGWTADITADTANKPAWIQALPQVLAAGLGAIALLRTSFTFKAGGTDVTIGPGRLVESILGAADSYVDRRRAQERAKAIEEVMADVSFSKSVEGLTTYILALMQNLSDPQQKEFGEQVKKLYEGNNTVSAIKVRILGLQIMNVVGEGVLVDAVKSLKPLIKLEPGEVDDTPPIPVRAPAVVGGLEQPAAQPAEQPAAQPAEQPAAQPIPPAQEGAPVGEPLIPPAQEAGVNLNEIAQVPQIQPNGNGNLPLVKDGT